MARNDIRISLEGAERVQSKLRDASLIGEPLRQETFEELGKLARDAGEKALDGGTGIAVRSIGAEVQPLSMRAFTAIGGQRAQQMDQGRPVGNARWLSDAQVSRWAGSVGHPDAGDPFLLRRDIRERGTRGLRFKEQMVRAVTDGIPRLLGRAAQAIQVRWGR